MPGNFVYPVHGNWGCAKCEVLWRGTSKVCWMCGGEAFTVGERVVKMKVRTAEMEKQELYRMY